jgi:hypothetical protein
MKAMKMPADPSSGSDLRRVLTNLLMLGMALTLLSGLITLKTLRPLSLILNLKKSITLFTLSLILILPR